MEEPARMRPKGAPHGAGGNAVCTAARGERDSVPSARGRAVPVTQGEDTVKPERLKHEEVPMLGGVGLRGPQKPCRCPWQEEGPGEGVLRHV